MDFFGEGGPSSLKNLPKTNTNKTLKIGLLPQKGNESSSSPIHIQRFLLLVLGRVEHQSTGGEKGGNSKLDFQKFNEFLPPNRFVSAGWWNGFKTDMSQPSDLNFLPSNEDFGGHKMTSTTRNVEHQGIAPLKSQIAYQKIYSYPYLKAVSFAKKHHFVGYQPQKKLTQSTLDHSRLPDPPPPEGVAFVAQV